MSKVRIRNSRKVTTKKTSKDVLSVLEAFGIDQGLELVYAFGKLFDSNVPLKRMLATGNLKLPKETGIFNMSSATDCPSLALGLCKACVINKVTNKKETVCYALKAEVQYPDTVLPYRQRQNSFWDNISAEDFVTQFLIINSTKRTRFTKIRFNESGDFHNQGCIIKADKIARLLKKFGVTCYCYTSRDDLDYSKVKHLVINGSSFKKKGIKNEFLMVETGKTPPKGYAKCPMDCTLCDRCSKTGKNTYVPQH